MKRFAVVATFLAVFVVLLGEGCQTASLSSPKPRPPLERRRNYAIHPIVAVVDFENRANFAGKWKLGEGMADVLTTELLRSKRVTVLERKHLDNVVGEILRQGKGLFREEGSVEKGRLKNAKYLISGAVTDFTVTGDVSGWFGVSDTAKVGARGQKARVSLNIRVSDVETGEIISSVKTESTAGSGWFGGVINYRKVSFGGDAFFRTPLGRATEAAIRKAVRRILRDLPTHYWQPRVAEAGPDTVIVNGGKNAGLREGDLFMVREEGRTITDPITGNVIETVPGRVVGRIQVNDVRETSAHAVYLEGEARRGYFLEPEEHDRRRRK